jgi:nitrite reductase/ring-hydroxylating ferredoxin subunit
MPWVTLCELSELTDGAGKPVDVDGFKLAVFLDGPTVAALDNTCPHAGVALSGGFVRDGCAVCPAHQWAFDLATGQLRDAPVVSVTRYPTRLFDFHGTRFVQADLPGV